jgi:hypothetical protein
MTAALDLKRNISGDLRDLRARLDPLQHKGN